MAMESDYCPTFGHRIRICHSSGVLCLSSFTGMTCSYVLMSEKQCVNMSGEKENDMITERNVIAIGADDGRTATEYGHGLSFRYPVQILLPCSPNGRVFPDHKAIRHCRSNPTWCSNKGMLLPSKGDGMIKVNPVRAVF